MNTWRGYRKTRETWAWKGRSEGELGDGCRKCMGENIFWRLIRRRYVWINIYFRTASSILLAHKNILSSLTFPDSPSFKFIRFTKPILKNSELRRKKPSSSLLNITSGHISSRYQIPHALIPCLTNVTYQTSEAPAANTPGVARWLWIL